jgi:D-xylose transport system substrate-binding protein
VNGQTDDSDAKSKVASTLLTPIWITPKNMAETVIKDGAVKVSEVCAGAIKAACTAAGIS